MTTKPHQYEPFIRLSLIRFIHNHIRIRPNAWLALALVISCFAFLPAASPAGAATFSVSSTADSGAGSLRQAVLDAAAGDMINFSLTTPATITLSTPITINKDLKIVGPGITSLSISGGTTAQIFKVTAGTLRISLLTLSNGRIAGQNANVSTPGTYNGAGGAVSIASGAGMTATDVNFSGNAAVGGNGGNAINSGMSFYNGAGGGIGGGPGAGGGFGGGGGGAVYGGSGGNPGGGGGGSTGANPGGAGGGGYGGHGGYTGDMGGFSAGGGGAGMGGAVFIDTGGAFGAQNVTFSGNSASGGSGGSANSGFGGGGGGGGAGLGSAVFNNGSYCALSGVNFSANTVTGGAAGNSSPGFGGMVGPATAGQGLDQTAGIFDFSSDHSCDVWYYPPTDITLTPASLDENRPTGTLAGTLASMDPDAGDTFTYTLVSGAGSTDNASFTISGGTLVTNAILNYEAKATYSVRIRTTDSHHKYFEKSFTLTINDANDPPNNISLSASTVAENQPSGTAVSSLTSTDEDPGQTHVYSLVNPGGTCTGTDNASFAISSSSLITNALFDFETKPSYTICIRSTDNGTPAQSFDKQFTISISNVNEAPTDIALAPASVAENQLAGAVVGTLSTTDPDTGQSFTYSLVNPGGGCSGVDNASFAISGATLVTTASFDFETKPSYTICIRSTDNGSPVLSFDKQLTVSISNANDAPINIALSSTSVAENQPSGATVGTLTSTDQDSGQTLVYSLVNPGGPCRGTDNGSFAISGDSLITTASFDYETKSGYTICVRTTDNGTPAQSYDKQFTISVTDVNEIPTNITLTPASVAENQPAGAAVGTLSTTDPDTGQSFIYTLVDPGGACSGTDNPSFAISGDSLVSAASYDYEIRSSYTICVRATDNGAPNLSVDKQFTVSVSDANDAPMDIALSSASVAENQLSGVTVGTLTSTDQDAGQTFTYSLVNPGGSCHGTDNGSFAISGSSLDTNTSLDYETRSSYTICVRTTDNGAPAQSFDKQFTITVTDTNDAPTDITLSPASVAENQPAGVLVGSLSTTDQDAGQSFTYALVDPGSACSGADNDSFAISNDTLTTAASFDFETKSSYTICIHSTDNGTPAQSFDKQLTISISNANETPTAISLSSTSVPENQSAGATVGALTTTDPDAGQSFIYTLVNPGGTCSGIDNASFAIGGSSLDTAASFDYETQNSYTVCVRTTDNGSPVHSFDQQFMITVADLNDAPTDITLTPASVAENQPTGSIVGTLTGVDQDAGQTHVYSLVNPGGTCSGVDNGSFSISGDTLLTAALFDFETKNAYSICISITDNGAPQQHFEKQLTVAVTGANDAPSDILLSSASVAENQPAGTLVGNLTTLDADPGQAHVYSLVNPGGQCSGADNGSFAISGSALNTAASFDYETRSSYTICIRTTDDGTPNLSLEKQFTIGVTNVSEAPHILSVDAATYTVGTPGAFTVSALGDPTAALSIPSGTLPAGLTFIDNQNGTASLAGTPAVGTGRIYSFTITAANPVSSDKQIFTLVVNEAPAITSPANAAFNAGAPNIFSIISSGYPHAAVSLAGALPAGVAFKDNQDGTASLSGIPAANSLGDYPLALTADNGIGAAAHQDFTLTVVNRPVVARVNSLPDTGDGQIVENELTGVAIQRLLVVFSSDMDPVLAADAASYRLVMGQNTPVAINKASYDQAFRTATLDLNEGHPLANGAYTLTVRSVLADNHGFLMTADFVRHFAIDLNGPVVLYENVLAYPGGIHVANGGSFSTHFTSLLIAFDSDVQDPAGDADQDDVTNPANYLLIQTGHNGAYDTTSCQSGLADDDVQIPVGPVTYSNNHGAGPFTAMLILNQRVPLPSGDYRLLVCGSTSIVDLTGNALNGGTDSQLQFTVFDPAASKKGQSLPETGFAPGITTAIPVQPAAQAYTNLDGLWLEIPALQVKASITGIPALRRGWDLTWLYKQVGWLTGTAFPTWNGNSVLTAHVYNADGTPGLFVKLKSLVYDQKITVHAYGYRYTYAVRANQKISASDSSWVFQHQDRSWLTLLTCEGYDPQSNTYSARRALRAVLLTVEPEP